MAGSLYPETGCVQVEAPARQVAEQLIFLRDQHSRLLNQIDHLEGRLQCVLHEEINTPCDPHKDEYPLVNLALQIRDQVILAEAAADRLSSIMYRLELP